MRTNYWREVVPRRRHRLASPNPVTFCSDRKRHFNFDRESERLGRPKCFRKSGKSQDGKKCPGIE
jgi:hypothetical protein